MTVQHANLLNGGPYLEKERVEHEAGEPTSAAAEPGGLAPPYEALEERAENGRRLTAARV